MIGVQIAPETKKVAKVAKTFFLSIGRSSRECVVEALRPREIFKVSKLLRDFVEPVRHNRTNEFEDQCKMTLVRTS